MTKPTVLESLTQQGVSRRGFLKFCSISASMLALPAGAVSQIAAALATTPMPSVIWLQFQECTGCTESILRAFSPTLETLILSQISLDYHETLFAASGAAAEKARSDAMRLNAGKYLLVVEGALPTKLGYCTNGGRDAIAILKEAAQNAALMIAVGACASFGGLPKAAPNPSGAMSVSELMGAGRIANKPLVNIPGCPPIAEVMSGVLVYYLTYKKLPELDSLKRPKTFYGKTVHDECPREDFYEEGLFAYSFDDEGARKGWCLFKLGCRGPRTRNACTKIKWNQGVSYPIRSGHGCLGCAEPNFWDRGSFYTPLAGGGHGGDEEKRETEQED